MMSLFRRFCLAWRIAKVSVWVDRPHWSREDETAMLLFMRSGIGGKLGMILRNMTLEQNARAVSQAHNLEFNCGYATGFRAAVSMLDELSGAGAVQVGESETVGAEDPEQQFRP